MQTRRQFLVLSSAACAAAAAPKGLFAERLGGPVFSNASVGAYQQGIMTLANFQALVGSTFTTFLENDDVAYLQLRAATAVTNATPTAVARTAPARGPQMAWIGPGAAVAAPAQLTETFALSFSNGGKAVPQGSYLMDNGTMGRFAIFLVPGTDAAGNPTSGATFNYLVENGSVKRILPTRGGQPVSDGGGAAGTTPVVRTGGASGILPGGPASPAQTGTPKGPSTSTLESVN
jgi:hypothetical protein